MQGTNSYTFPATFYTNKITKFSILVSILFLILSIILVVFRFSQLPPEIPLFYSTKTQILAKKIFIITIPLIIFLNLIVNLTISKFFFEKMAFLAKVTAIAATIVSFLVFWAELEIILLF